MVLANGQLVKWFMAMDCIPSITLLLFGFSESFGIIRVGWGKTEITETERCNLVRRAAAAAAAAPAGKLADAHFLIWTMF
ncbi:hypothetical protein BD324DRAFT_202940 [Kockovaella imperatae]|uniref:Uncharacterized protein n=1 Tax=Kockovaella imperatae TaxID=4999 RepID=A0A1Y1U742_9TREE|nr:hypothetical protein BD324DRAFT_202940 [Kockovaella imperatae]ORX33822.1 hypothetical protein BD324DRAFT_202940 [Kockovaella imperatae]